jgi:hypothetical protein
MPPNRRARPPAMMAAVVDVRFIAGIMTEAYFGRPVAASLHQAIGEELPQRLEFYENWLHSEGLRDGTIGLAPLVAVLGFLRTEGGAYDRVVRRAGALSAEWMLLSSRSMGRRLVHWLPVGLRRRAALRVARRICAAVDTRNPPRIRARGRTLALELSSSVFCSVRSTHQAPLCGFYESLTATTLAHFGLPSAAVIEECRAMGGRCCLISFNAGAALSAEPEAAAA